MQLHNLHQFLFKRETQQCLVDIPSCSYSIIDRTIPLCKYVKKGYEVFSISLSVERARRNVVLQVEEALVNVTAVALQMYSENY